MTTHPSERVQDVVFSFFEDFKPLFSRAEFDDFVILVLALLSDTRNKSVAGLARQADGLKDHSVLSKFLQCKNLGGVYAALRDLFFQRVDWRKPVYFYLDDTLVEKTGKLVHAEFNYSTTRRKTVASNCFVVGLAKNNGLALPFDFAKYFHDAKPFKSKIVLALAMMRCFLRHCKQNARVYFVFDSWYACKQVIKLVREANALFVTRLKSNRVIHAGKTRGKHSLEEYAKTIPARKFKETRLSNGKTFYACSRVLCVNKVGRVKIVFTRKKKHGRKTVFIATNDFALSDAEVIEKYAERWGIEQFFKELKNEFGFDEYRETRQKAVSRHITLSLASYSLAALAKQFLDEATRATRSIGVVLEKIRDCVHVVKRALLARLYRRKLKNAIH